MGSERREFERVPFELTADYKVFLQKTLKKEELFYGKAGIINISGGGIQVKLHDVSSDLLQELLATQRKLLLEFSIPLNSRIVKVYGKMAWAKQEGSTQAGVCFVDIGVDEQKLIADFVEQNLSRNN